MTASYNYDALIEANISDAARRLRARKKFENTDDANPDTKALLDITLRDFIADIERSYLRTEHDIGANHSALYLWNLVRGRAGLPPLDKDDLTTAAEYCDRTRDAISEREYPLMPRVPS